MKARAAPLVAALLLGLAFQTAFEEGLRERGRVEGRNVEVIYCAPASVKEGNPFRPPIDELLRAGVDVLVTFHNDLKAAEAIGVKFPGSVLVHSRVVVP